ncbi:sulfatase-like hydrolase/transferase, partial [Nostoc sp. NIES-2111]
MLLALLLILPYAPDRLIVYTALLFPFLVGFLFAFPLSFAWGLTVLVVWGVSVAFVDAASLFKIYLTQVPITSLDVRITFFDPFGFFDAMKWSRLTSVIVVGAILLIYVTVISGAMQSILRGRRAIWPILIAVALLCTLTGATFHQFGSRLLTAMNNAPDVSDDLWSPEGLSKTTLKVGGFSFLLATSMIDEKKAILFSDLPTVRSAVAQPSMRSTLINDWQSSGDKKPNIVMVLMESTFDLNDSFDIQPKVESPLYGHPPGAILDGRLRVNTLGGGTWITEFETISGMDTRLFGYAGYYTHVTLAPYLHDSLARYLAQRGYRTLGLYPVSGTSYSARKAYAQYGFSEFLDGEHFHIQHPYGTPDDGIVSTYLKDLDGDDSKPFFAVALTAYNHAPHPCSPETQTSLTYRFVGNTVADRDCQLNEYVNRMRTTERAIALLEDHLSEAQRRTGRSYLLVIYGDHQPHTFVGTQVTFYSHNYDDLRRSDKLTTIYQF